MIDATPAQDDAAAEEIVLYEKDPETMIATITFNRPGYLNAMTIKGRHRYGELIHRANIDNDVKVLVVRGNGDDFGSGGDLPELRQLRAQDPDSALRAEVGFEDDPDVSMPPHSTYRAASMIPQWYTTPQAGARSLQDFKKISILEVKGYCYGWHFYQAADADLVIASDDALFGHPAFRYAGWGPRMWSWALLMGLRKFQEMVFTGRPFTAQEMYDCNFVNSVVPREHLEDEVAKYALSCSRTRPADTVFAQKVFFQTLKQFQGEYLGSILSGWLESMGRYIQPDGDDPALTEDVFVKQRMGSTVRDNDLQFPPDWRLSKSGREKVD